MEQSVQTPPTGRVAKSSTSVGDQEICLQMISVETVQPEEADNFRKESTMVEAADHTEQMEEADKPETESTIVETAFQTEQTEKADKPETESTVVLRVNIYQYMNRVV